MDQFTSNYGWIKPDVGASDDSWGDKLNADLDSIDGTVKSIENALDNIPALQNVMKKSLDGTYWDGENIPLRNIANGSTPTDAVTKGQLDAAIVPVSQIPAMQQDIADLKVSDGDQNIRLDALEAPGSVATGDIADGAITLAKLAPNSVDASKIVDGSVGATELADGAVTTAKIGDGQVAYAKLPDVAAARLLGRGSMLGVGDPEELTVDGSLAFNGTVVQRAALTGDVTANAGSNSTAVALVAVKTLHMMNIPGGNLCIQGNFVNALNAASRAQWSTASSATWSVVARGAPAPMGTCPTPCALKIPANTANQSSTSGASYNECRGGEKFYIGASLARDGGVYTASNFTVYGQFYLADGTTTNVYMTAPVITTAWQYFEAQITAPANAAGVVFGLTRGGSASDTAIIYATNCTLERYVTAQRIAPNGGIEMSASGQLQRSALTGDVIANAGSGATTIQTRAIHRGQLQNVPAGNLVLGGQFSTAIGTASSAQWGTLPGAWSVVAYNAVGVPAGCPARNLMKMPPDAAISQYLYNNSASQIEVIPGEHIFLGFAIAADGAMLTNGAVLGLQFWKNDGTVVQLSLQATAPNGSWSFFDRMLTVPANCCAVSAFIQRLAEAGSANLYMTSITVERYPTSAKFGPDFGFQTTIYGGRIILPPRSITLDKMAWNEGGNLVPNGNFMAPSGTNTIPVASNQSWFWSAPAWSVVARAGGGTPMSTCPAMFAVAMPPNAGTAAAIYVGGPTWITHSACQPGDKIWVSVYAAIGAGTISAGSLGMYLHVLLNDGTITTSPFVSMQPTTSWQRFEFQLTVPANGQAISFALWRSQSSDTATIYATMATCERYVTQARLPATSVFTQTTDGLAPKTVTAPDTTRYLRSDGTWGVPTGTGTGLANAYASVTDGAVTANAGGADTFKMRSSDSSIVVAVQNNDATHGDNVNLTTSGAWNLKYDGSVWRANSKKISDVADATSAQDAVTKTQLDAEATARTNADNSLDGRLDSAEATIVSHTSSISTLTSSKVAKAGDTMTGPLVLSGDPTSPLHPTTKQYVDAGLSGKANLSGADFTGTVSAPEFITSAPALGLEAISSGPITVSQSGPYLSWYRGLTVGMTPEQKAAQLRWLLWGWAEPAGESGVAVGSNLYCSRYNNLGELIAHAWLVNRSTGQTTFETAPSFPTPAVGAHVNTAATVGFVNNAIVAASVPDDSITFAKMQPINTDKLIGRDAAGVGNPAEIGVDTTLGFDGANNLRRAAITGDVSIPIGSNVAAIPVRTVLADQVSFHNGGNLVANPAFCENTNVNAVQISSKNWANLSPALISVVARGGAAPLNAAPSPGVCQLLPVPSPTTASYILAGNQFYEVIPGETLNLTVYAAANGSVTAGTCYINLRFLLSDGVTNSYVANAFTPTGTWQKFTFKNVVPATAISVQVYLQRNQSTDTSNVYMTMVFVERFATITVDKVDRDGDTMTGSLMVTGGVAGLSPAGALEVSAPYVHRAYEGLLISRFLDSNTLDQKTQVTNAVNEWLNASKSQYATLDLEGRVIGINGSVTAAGNAAGSKWMKNGRLKQLATSALVLPAAVTKACTTPAVSPDTGSNALIARLPFLQVDSTATLKVGMELPANVKSGGKIPRGCYIMRIVNATQIELSCSLLWLAAGDSISFQNYAPTMMFDFSAITGWNDCNFQDVIFDCQKFCGVMQLPKVGDGSIQQWLHCQFDGVHRRGVLMCEFNTCFYDLCKGSSSESQIPPGSRTVQFAIIGGDSKISRNQLTHFAPCFVCDAGCHYWGNHNWGASGGGSWSPSYSQLEDSRQPFLVLGGRRCNCVITGNYIDNSFVEVTDEHAMNKTSDNAQMGYLGFTNNRCSVNLVRFDPDAVPAPPDEDSLTWAEDQGKNFSFIKFKSFLNATIDADFATGERRRLKHVVIEGNTFSQVDATRSIDYAMRGHHASTNWIETDPPNQPDYIRIEKNMYLGVNFESRSRPTMKQVFTGVGATERIFDFTSILPLKLGVRRIVSIQAWDIKDNADVAQPLDRVMVVSVVGAIVTISFINNTGAVVARKGTVTIAVDGSESDI